MSIIPLPGKDFRRVEVLPGQGGAGIQNLAIFVVVIAALYFGREIFVPLALAVLLSFALAPLVSWLRRVKVPRTPAVFIVVLFAFACIFAFGAIVAGQVSQLAGNLPRYQSNITEKISDLRSNAGGGFVERASEVLEELGEQIGKPTEGKPRADELPSAANNEREPEPIPVQVQPPELDPLQLLQSIIGPMVTPIATGGIVIVFVIFMLLQREDLRDRFIRLAGSSDLQRTTQALSEAGKRVAKYLLMQLVVNATYGIPIGVGLWLIGVPNPLLWGMLAMVLRFVPYIGPVIAAVFPLALAIAVDSGWTMFFWTAALFVALELISNNFVEPWLYGSSTGLSPVAIIAAAIFWTWLWGPVGLLLSTPLTVCLVVLGRHVPQFSFLDVLLGSEPVLTGEESLYQRLLAGDPEEATERAEEFLEDNSLLTFYEEVAIPALALVEHDRARGVLDEERRAVVAAGALTLVDNLSDHEDEIPPEAHAEDKSDEEEVTSLRAAVLQPAELALEWNGKPVLCAGGRGNLDDVAAEIHAQLLERAGIGARTAPFEALASKTYGSLELDGVRLVCISFMNAGSLAHARFLVRRLRRRTNAPIMVCFWSMAQEDEAERDLVKTTRADLSSTSLGASIEQVAELATRTEGTQQREALKRRKAKARVESSDLPHQQSTAS